MTLTALPPHWGLQPFEHDLAALELEGITGQPAIDSPEGWAVSGPTTRSTVERTRRRIALARAVRTPSGDRPTVQSELEESVGGGRRKVTSHALHGLHAYKGKFYPQLARAALNACGVPTGGRVLDPFAGCGTTVLEAALLGLSGHGIDANPLAVSVSRAKLTMLSHEPAHLAEVLAPLTAPPSSPAPIGDAAYIKTWLPTDNFDYLGRLLAAMAKMTPDARAMAMVVISSVLREASLQDPKQLRVYRRKPGIPIKHLSELVDDALAEALDVVGCARAISEVNWDGMREAQERVRFGDARWLIDSLGSEGKPASFDAVVTSPPYANALPYIDTDRLSLRAFGLLGSDTQRSAEDRLIGNREIGTRTSRQLNGEVTQYLEQAGQKPHLLRNVLRQAVAGASEPTAGFRRQRTPGLLWAYFRDMHGVLEQTSRLLKPGAPAVWVVGDSTITGPRGTVVPVPTTDILIDLGSQCGLVVEHDLGKRLTSFGASSTVHQRNAMESERVVVFRRQVD